jgi:WD40 repeat protein
VAPNSKLLASGGSDAAVRLWDAATGAQVAELKGHHGCIMAVAFSPQGDRLASGSWDESKGTGDLKIWDVDRTSKNFGKEQRSFAGYDKGVTCLAFANDGRLLASGGVDHNVLLWHVESGQKKHEIAAHQGIVRSLAFSPDGRTLATGSDDTVIRLWDPDGGKERPLRDRQQKETPRARPLESHTGAVMGLAFAPDSRSLASASADRTVILWDVEFGLPRATLRGHGGIVSAVSFSRGGKTVASGSQDRSVKLWDAGTGAERFTFTGHAGPVRAVAFAPDRTLLVSGSHDGTVRLWRAAPPEQPPVVPLPE